MLGTKEGEQEVAITSLSGVHPDGQRTRLGPGDEADWARCGGVSSVDYRVATTETTTTAAAIRATSTMVAPKLRFFSR
jgi:hypothetical protein